MAPILNNLDAAHPHFAIDANYSDVAVDLLAAA
jgi:hypothetical protein